MGIGGIGIWQLVIILVIVLLLFGTKRLRGLGGDLGGALKGFKKAMSDDKKEGDADEEPKEPEKVSSEKTASSETVKDTTKTDSKL